MSLRFVMKYRTTIVISGVIVFLVLYVITSYHVFIASAFGLHRSRNRTASPQLGPTTMSEVKGQAPVFYVWCGSRR